MASGAKNCRGVPPNTASNWSATMMERPMVTSAWRNSCPCIQPSSSFCTSAPKTAAKATPAASPAYQAYHASRS